jgi:transposase
MTKRRQATQAQQDQSFKGRQFTAEVILWARLAKGSVRRSRMEGQGEGVRWYLMFPISYRDLELMLHRIAKSRSITPPSFAVGVDGPRRHQWCQNEVVFDLRQRRPPVEQITRIGMDTSKHVFQLHGVNAAEAPVLRKKLRRKKMVAFFEKLEPTVIAIEACGASHQLARLLQSFGHTVKLIAPQLAKPYVKRGKNDAADAEALCEAMSRPTMRFVPVKTMVQQAALMLVGVRDRLIRNRTQLANTIRGYAAEFGLTAAKGMAHLAPLLDRIEADESLPALARELFAIQAKEYEQLQAQIDEVDTKLAAWHRADECSRRLVKIPSVGPIGAALLRMKTPDPTQFESGRQFAAWIGLTPKDHSTAGKARLGVITRAGDEALRSVLVVGATAVIQQAQRSGKASPWLIELLKRKSPKLAAVALANKTARIAWKMMLTGETYSAPSAVMAARSRGQPFPSQT